MAGKRLVFRAGAPFTAVYLAIQSLPGCEDASLACQKNPSNPSRLFLLNCLDPAFTDPLDPQCCTFAGAVQFGRNPSCDICLKDRAISTTHGQLTWRLEVQQSCPSTDSVGFSKGDSVTLVVTFTDSSTNGSFEGETRLPKKTPHPILPKAVISQQQDPFTLSADSAAQKPSEPLCLGRSRDANSSAATPIWPGKGRPVFAFQLCVLLTAPWNEPRRKPSAADFRFLPYEVPPDNVRFISFRGAQASSAPRMVKAEPGVAWTARQNSNLVADLEGHDLVAASPAPQGSPPGSAAYKARIDELLEQVKVLSSEKEAATRRKNEIEISAREVQQELFAATSKIRELERSEAETRRRSETKDREREQKINEIEVELGLCQRKAATLAAQLTSVGKERDEAVADRTRLADEVERLEAKRRQAADQSVAAEARLEEVSQQLNELRAELAANATVAAQEQRSREAERDRALQELAAKEAELAGLERRMTEIQSSAEASLRSAESEIMRAKHSAVAAKRRYEKNRIQLLSMTSQFRDELLTKFSALLATLENQGGGSVAPAYDLPTDDEGADEDLDEPASDPIPRTQDQITRVTPPCSSPPCSSPFDATKGLSDSEASQDDQPPTDEENEEDEENVQQGRQRRPSPSTSSQIRSKKRRTDSFSSSSAIVEGEEGWM